MEKRLLLLACLALTTFVLAWVLIRPPDAGPPVAEVIRNAPAPAAPVPLQRVPLQRPPGLAGSVSSEAPAPRSVAARRAAELPDTDVALALGVGVKEPVPDHDLVAARVKTIEESVVHVLSAVAPELDLDAVTHRCADDGSKCTFEGPWPGDDFLGRWVRAIGDGEVADDLRGVTFRSFEPAEDADGRPIFRIVALGPPAPSP